MHFLRRSIEDEAADVAARADRTPAPPMNIGIPFSHVFAFLCACGTQIRVEATLEPEKHACFCSPPCPPEPIEWSADAPVQCDACHTEFTVKALRAIPELDEAVQNGWEVKPRAPKSREPLMCANEECDFSTTRAADWHMHRINTGHALLDRDDDRELDLSGDTGPTFMESYRASHEEHRRLHS